MINWKLTGEEILSFSGGLYVSSARSSWFSGDKQGTLTLFFSVVKPVYEQFFVWNCCVNLGFEGKIWKLVQNSFLTGFFTGKMKINLLGTWNIPFSWQTVRTSLGRIFWLKTWYIHVFSRKSQKVDIFGKNARDECFRSKYWQFSANLVKYFPFPHLDVSLMAKDLAQIKVYTYFNIGYAKTLVKLKEKQSKFSRSCSIYPSFSGKFWGFFCLACSKFRSSNQVIAWNCYNCAYSILE